MENRDARLFDAYDTRWNANGTPVGAAAIADYLRRGSPGLLSAEIEETPID